MRALRCLSIGLSLALVGCGSDDASENGGSAGSAGTVHQDGGSGSGGGTHTGGGGGTNSGGGAGTGGLPNTTCPSDPIDGFQGTGAKPEAHATFHAIGLYWKPEGGAPDNECLVRVRRRGECDWKSGEPLWFDPN